VLPHGSNSVSVFHGSCPHWRSLCYHTAPILLPCSSVPVLTVGHCVTTRLRFCFRVPWFVISLAGDCVTTRLSFCFPILRYLPSLAGTVLPHDSVFVSLFHGTCPHCRALCYHTAPLLLPCSTFRDITGGQLCHHTTPFSFSYSTVRDITGGHCVTTRIRFCFPVPRFLSSLAGTVLGHGSTSASVFLGSFLTGGHCVIIRLHFC
jgi:hypothetical protein